jgi:group I intron endonuclease
MRPIFIYVLRDPRNDRIRYVGKTIQNPRDRLSAHIRQAKRDNKSHRDRWILQVLDADKKPVVEIIEEATEENWEEREQYWIAHYDNLTNETAGGEGLHGHRFSDDHRRKLGEAQAGNTKWLGRKHKPETRAKMSVKMSGENNPNYGKTFTKEYRKKLSEAQKGRRHSDETRRKMSQAAKGNTRAKGHKQTEEHKQRAIEARAATRMRKAKERLKAARKARGDE